MIIIAYQILEVKLRATVMETRARAPATASNQFSKRKSDRLRRQTKDCNDTRINTSNFIRRSWIKENINNKRMKIKQMKSWHRGGDQVAPFRAAKRAPKKTDRKLAMQMLSGIQLMQRLNFCAITVMISSKRGNGSRIIPISSLSCQTLRRKG